VKKRNEMLTLTGDQDVTVQAGKPMTVRREAALPLVTEVGFASVFSFFSLKVSSGGGLARLGKAGGASAPLRGFHYA
jgi:hypothetical protein